MRCFQRMALIGLGVLMGALPAASAGAEITIALGSEPTTLDPQIREDGGRTGGERQYLRNPDGADTRRGNWYRGWPPSPTLVDPKTWEVKLRPGITFHNGEPFNADAVVYSIKRIIDPKFNSEQISFFNTIQDAEKVDDLTVRIITDGPDPILLSRLYWMKMVPAAYSKDANFAEAPVGTGPYKFVEWKRGQT